MQNNVFKTFDLVFKIASSFWH